MYIMIKYMIINYYLCPSIAYYSSFAPSMIHSMHHMIIILNIYINIIIKYMIINLYLHIAAPATIAHTYHLSIAPLSVTCIAMIIIINIYINIIIKYMIINLYLHIILPHLLQLLIPITYPLLLYP